jgi:hypothetical protein
LLNLAICDEKLGALLSAFVAYARVLATLGSDDERRRRRR